MTTMTPHEAKIRLALLVAVVSMADFVFGAIGVAHMLAAGLSPAAVGGLLGVVRLLSLAVEAPSGAVGDRFGQRGVLLTGLVVWGAGLVVFALADGPATFFVAVLLWACGMACYSGAPSALVIDQLTTSGQERAMGGVIRVAQVTGWIASGLGGAVVMATARIPRESVIIGSGVLLVLAAGWVAASWPDSRTRSADPVLATLVRGLRCVRSGSLLRIALLTAVASAATAVLLLSWQPIALDAGASEPSLGLLLLVMTALAALGAMASTWAEAKPAVWVGLATVGLAACLAATAVGGAAALAAVLAAEVAIGLSMAATGVWGQQVFPDDLRNTLGSVMSVVSGLAMGLVDVLFGLSWQAWGLQTALVAWGVGLGLLTLGAMTVPVGRSALTPVPLTDSIVG